MCHLASTTNLLPFYSTILCTQHVGIQPLRCDISDQNTSSVLVVCYSIIALSVSGIISF